jgi:very-short-patch-repair endonuclease
MTATIAFARRLRKSMTLPEVALWRELRRRAVDGLKFRRQQPFGPYVLDFYCPSHRLAVEVDGWCHNQGDQPGKDERRDQWLQNQGVHVLRLVASDVLYRPDDVMSAIIGEAARIAPLSRLRRQLPRKGGA